MESHLQREEKYQTWSSAVFPFGGISNPACQVLAHGSPLECPLPPLLVLGSSGLFATPDCICLIFRCGKEECGSAKVLL